MIHILIFDSNLTNANHIIFAHPYLAERKTYKAAMLQARGRSQRYGQLKHVHIYHWFTLNTIDVDVFQAGEKSILVPGEGGKGAEGQDRELPFSGFKQKFGYRLQKKKGTEKGDTLGTPGKAILDNYGYEA
jgi:hypothetical protein